MDEYFTSMMLAVELFLVRGGAVLWGILFLALCLWWLLLDARSRLVEAEKRWLQQTRVPSERWQQLLPKGRTLLLESAVQRSAFTVAGTLRWAKTLVVILPLLGLLGTVAGMIDCFESVADTGSGTLTSLTDGISAALVTTLAGLVSSLPGLVAVHRLERRSHRMTVKVRQNLRRFICTGYRPSGSA